MTMKNGLCTIVPTLFWLPKLHKNPKKQDLLLILVLGNQDNSLRQLVNTCTYNSSTLLFKVD